MQVAGLMQRPFFSEGRPARRLQTPNSKLQRNPKLQAPKYQARRPKTLRRSFGFGFWSFFGAWNLVLGIFNGIWLCPLCGFFYASRHVQADRSVRPFADRARRAVRRLRIRLGGAPQAEGLSEGQFAPWFAQQMRR